MVSPLPSAQPFMAAGLLDLPLGLFTLAFLLGRLVSYSIYVAAATLADEQLGTVLSQVFGSPWSIALQVVLLSRSVFFPSSTGDAYWIDTQKNPMSRNTGFTERLLAWIARSSQTL